MICNNCNCELNNINWSCSAQKRNYKICKLCANKKSNERYYLNKEKYLNNVKSKYQLLKQEVFKYYGSICVDCGESNIKLLSLDHIDLNGRKHRRSVLKNDSGTSFYKWVFKNKPNNLQLKCFNCNCKTNMGKSDLSINYNKNCKYCNNICKFRVCNNCKQIIKRNKQIDLKIEVFQNYGNFCKNCGQNNLECLTIDHINNDGANHRREIGTNIYDWLKKNNFPKDNFQILCYNCNISKCR